jgi:hypothetical protein
VPCQPGGELRIIHRDTACKTGIKTIVPLCEKRTNLTGFDKIPGLPVFPDLIIQRGN